MKSGHAGNLGEGASDMGGGEAVVAGHGGGKPGGAGEEGETAREAGGGAGQEFGGRRVEMTTGETDGTQGGFEVLEALGGGPGLEAEVPGQAGEEGPVVAQLEGAQEIIVAKEDEGEGGLVGQVEAEQQAYLFQGGVGEVLGLVEHDDEGTVFEFAQGGFEALEVGLTAKARALAELGHERRQDAGTGEGGLGEGDGGEESRVQSADPPTGEGTLADAVGPADQERAPEGGGVIELTPGVDEFGRVEPLGGSGLVERDVGGSPLAGQTLEIRVFHSGSCRQAGC